MGLPYIILGFIKFEDGLSGYDLKQLIDESTSNFWQSDISGVYRALDSLEKKGWIISTPDPDNNRNRKTYSLKPEGEAALIEWLEAEPEKRHIRRPELIRVFFGSLYRHERMREQILAMRQKWQMLGGIYEGIAEEIRTVDRVEHPQDAPFWLLTVRQGQILGKAYIEWCDEVLATLDQLEKQQASSSTDHHQTTDHQNRDSNQDETS